MENPFRTAPGSDPPILVGRDGERSAARNALALTRSGAPAQPIVFTGLRGMGKTAILRRVAADAAGDDAVVIAIEASASEPLAATYRAGIERARQANASLPERLRRTFDAVVTRLPKTSIALPGDIGTVALNAGEVPDDDAPLAEAMHELNDVARRQGRFLVLAIDEIQEAPPTGLRDIVRLVHETAGSASPIALIGAGLPNAKERLHAVRTYTERWRFFNLDLLTHAEAKDAIAIPLAERDVTILPTALDRLADASAGYPFFVQEYGSAIWNAKRGKTIGDDEVDRVLPGVRRVLEADFYEGRLNRLSPRETAYVLAMADLGPGPHTSYELADLFGTTSDKLSSIRAQLVKKDVAFSPAPGLIAFRIPLTERYVLAHREAFEQRARSSSIKRV